MRMMVLLMELIVRHPTIDAEDDMVAAVEVEVEADSSLMTTATEVVPAKVESKRRKSDLRA